MDSRPAGARFVEMKSKLRRLPGVLPAWRLLKQIGSVPGMAVAGVGHWGPHRLSVTYRKGVFDAAPRDALLVANVGEERYVVASRDRVIGRLLFARGSFDYNKFATVLDLLGPDFRREQLIDVGGNIGTLCIPAVNRNLFERAVAIEPDPFNFNLLVANIAINALRGRIQAVNLACGSTADETLVFELSQSNLADHRVRIGAGESDRQTISVKSEPLDSIVTDASACNTLLWIDTQGFEGHVLQGASRLLAANVPLVIEFWPLGLKRSGSFATLKSALARAGYRRCVDITRYARPLELDPNALDALYEEIGEGDEFTDLLFF